jgi:hypothetical protein
VPPPDAISSLGDQLECLIAKFRGKPANLPVPAWILPPLSCEFLRELSEVLPAPRRAFEFGSGQSTTVLRAVSTASTSIEHASEWLRRTEEQQAAARRESDYSTVVPLKLCWNRLRLIESFDLDSHLDVVDRLRQSQLILVDSPPNPAKREHVLFQALNFAPVGSIIVLDDLEVGAVARFAARLANQNSAQFRFWHLKIDHQLGIFLKRKTGHVRSLPTLREFIGAWIRV